jgi:hypothetical protein
MQCKLAARFELSRSLKPAQFTNIDSKWREVEYKRILMEKHRPRSRYRAPFLTTLPDVP